MNLEYLIEHPEQLNKETLHKLRERLAQYPYNQTVRLLMLQNLFLLHDPSFGEELRRTALFIPNRRIIFDMVEGTHYKISQAPSPQKEPMDTDLADSSEPEDRTDNLINNFLSSTSEFNIKRNNRPLTVADATTDYAAYLLELDDIQPEVEKQDDLINTYINNNNGSERIVLQEEPTYTPKLQNQDTDDGGDEFFTETLAKIYTKQGNYDKAIEIITKLNLNYPKKSSYFADQLRFLRKLQLINNKTKQ